MTDIQERENEEKFNISIWICHFIKSSLIDRKLEICKCKQSGELNVDQGFVGKHVMASVNALKIYWSMSAISVNEYNVFKEEINSMPSCILIITFMRFV